MDKIFTKYEKLFRDKTAFEKAIWGKVEVERSLFNSNPEIELHRYIPNLGVSYSDRKGVYKFLNEVIEDCSKISTSLNNGIKKQKFNSRKIEMLHSTVHRLNMLFDLIELLQKYYPVLTKKKLNELGLKYFDSGNFIPSLKDIAMMDVIEQDELINDYSKSGNPFDKYFEIITTRYDDYKISMYSEPLVLCLFHFTTVFMQVLAQHQNLWQILYKLEEFSGANDTRRIKLVYRNPNIIKDWQSKLNLNTVYVENVYASIEAHFYVRFHEMLGLFLKNQPFEGRIQFNGDWKDFLDVFFRLKRYNWVDYHSNETLFNLLQEKFLYCPDGAKEAKNFTKYHFTYSIRKDNYLAKTDALYIEGLPYMAKNKKGIIPEISSQKKKGEIPDISSQKAN